MINMRKIGLILTLGLMLVSGCKKENRSAENNTLFAVNSLGSSLPYLVVKTEETIQNEPKIPGTLTAYRQGETLWTTPIGIEYRGSTSYRLSDKKSFGIETWDEAGEDVALSLFDMPKKKIGS